MLAEETSLQENLMFTLTESDNVFSLGNVEFDIVIALSIIVCPA